MNMTEEIALKSNSLPFELQREVLDFIEFIAHKRQLAAQSQAAPRPAFRSVRGLLKHRNLDNLEQDFAEVRREMWGNFPREEPK